MTVFSFWLVKKKELSQENYFPIPHHFKVFLNSMLQNDIEQK